MKRISMFYIVCLIIFTLVPFVNAEEFNRAGSLEMFTSGYFMDNDSVDIKGISGIEVGIDNINMYGLGMGYNINNYLNLNIQGSYGSTDGVISVFGMEGESDIDLYGMNLNLDYNILKTRFTPFVTVGVGCMTFDIDDNIADNLFGGTYGTVNAGAGVRYDLTNNFLIKALYRVTWVDELDYTKDNLVFEGFNFIIGYRF